MRNWSEPWLKNRDPIRTVSFVIRCTPIQQTSAFKWINVCQLSRSRLCTNEMKYESLGQKAVQPLGCWAFFELSLLSQGRQDSTQVPLHVGNGHGLQQPACVLHFLKIFRADISKSDHIRCLWIWNRYFIYILPSPSGYPGPSTLMQPGVQLCD